MRATWPRRSYSAVVVGASLALACATLVACAESAPNPPEPSSEPSDGPSPDATSETDDGPTPDATPETDERSESPSPAPDAPDSDVPDDWQEVNDEGISARFFVPPTWEVRTHSGEDRDVPHPVYGAGYCDADPGLLLGSAVLTWTDETTDAGEAVRVEAERAAEVFFGDRQPEVTLEEVTETEVWASVPARVDLAPSDDPCAGEQALIAVKGASYPDGSGTFLFIVVGELGHPESPPAEDIVGIVNSLEPIDD